MILNFEIIYYRIFIREWKVIEKKLYLNTKSHEEIRKKKSKKFVILTVHGRERQDFALIKSKSIKKSCKILCDLPNWIENQFLKMSLSYYDFKVHLYTVDKDFSSSPFI